jgi:glycosyltransferase involved in cell wall biosynthesis
VKKIKILQITTSTVGGPGQLVLDLAKYLDQEKFEVSVGFGPGYALDEEFHKEGIRTFHISMSRNIAPLVNIKGFFQIYKLIKRERFDIVHTHCSIGSFLGRIGAKMAGCPIIILQDQGLAFAKDYQSIISPKRIYLLVERLLEPWTDWYIAVSEALRQIEFKNKVAKPEKVSVIYNGIDNTEFNTRVDVEKVKEEVGLNSKIPVIGVIGRLEPQKRVDVFLRAASMIITSGFYIQFLIVGDGPLRKELETLAVNLNIAEKVLFLGWRRDVYKLLAVMDIFCLSSGWEGMPLVVLEAMSMGRPVISTRVRGIDEVVENRKTGIIVPLNDPKALAEACILLLNNYDLAAKMGKAGRRKFDQMFTVKKMINEYQQLYLELYENLRIQT